VALSGVFAIAVAATLSGSLRHFSSYKNKTHKHLYSINQDNMALIPVIQYQLKYYKHGGLKVCCNIYGA